MGSKKKDSRKDTASPSAPPKSETPFDLEAWLRKLEAIEMDDKFVEAVEYQVANRLKNSSRHRW